MSADSAVFDESCGGGLVVEVPYWRQRLTCSPSLTFRSATRVKPSFRLQRSVVKAEIKLTSDERSGRYPVLTAEGNASLADARQVAGHIDLFKARARGLAGGLETELSVALHVLFPTSVFTAAVADYQKEFPRTPLRMSVEGREP